MTNVVSSALAELLAEAGAAGARPRLARPGPEDFVVAELGIALELRALAREKDRP
jgi:hypothetical protein